METKTRVRTDTPQMSDLGFGSTLKDLDVSASLRKLANPNAILVATKLFQNNSMTFRELQRESMLPTNTLTHTLYVLKNADIVVKERDRYYLTNYGVILLEAIKQIRDEMKTTEGNLFAPNQDLSP
jgi:DNA-binding HxlR family transcriptional regulator